MGFLKKNKQTGKYESTILGVKAIDLLDLLQQNLTDEEAPFLCEKFVRSIYLIKFSQRVISGCMGHPP